MKTEQMETLLCDLLECGIMDLSILEDCEYPMYELIEYVTDNFGEKPNINNLCYAMFQMALDEAYQAIIEKVNDLEEELQDSNLPEERRAIIKKIVAADLSLTGDTESFHNYLDTSIYFTDNEEIYREYFSTEIEIFEGRTGFSLL